MIHIIQSLKLPGLYSEYLKRVHPRIRRYNLVFGDSKIMVYAHVLKDVELNSCKDVEDD